jgi:hypothetical protein
VSRWAFVVLNWNGRDDTLSCLASLRAVRGDASVVVADNGSTDGSVEAIRREHPEVTVVENGSNLGFSGGNNAAIRRSLADGADWVVLVNNDATLAHDALDELRAAAARHPEAGILAGKLFFPEPPDLVQWAGQRVDLVTGYSGRPRGYGRPDRPAYRREEPVDRAVGALMAVSRPAIERAGLLDEELFAYVEDVDWCLRIRAAGFGCVFTPSVRAWHALTASTGGAASTHPLYYGTRNTIVVVERHRPLSRVGTALRRAAVMAAFSAHALAVRRSRRALRAVLDGYADARRGRLGERPASTRASS